MRKKEKKTGTLPEKKILFSETKLKWWLYWFDGVYRQWITIQKNGNHKVTKIYIDC